MKKALYMLKINYHALNFNLSSYLLNPKKHDRLISRDMFGWPDRESFATV